MEHLNLSESNTFFEANPTEKCYGLCLYSDFYDLIAVVGQHISQDASVKAYYYMLDHTHLRRTVQAPDVTALYLLVKTAYGEYFGKL